SLGRVLAAQGAEVTREYYINDAGAQMDRFARSLIAAAEGKPTPEDGYAGEYIKDIAAEALASQPGALDLPEEERLRAFRQAGLELMLAAIKKSLHGFGVDFDVYFSETSLHSSGEVEQAVERL